MRERRNTPLCRRNAPRSGHTVPGTIRTALIAAGLASAAIAAPGLAQTPPTSPPPAAASSSSTRPGSRLGFLSSVTGDDTGTSRAVCTDVGGRALMCTLELDLAKGTITAQGMLPRRAHDVPVAVIGGTGAYNGARGTALATDVSSSKTTIDVPARLRRPAGLRNVTSPKAIPDAEGPGSPGRRNFYFLRPWES
jgi:hypothetical protein